MVSKKECNRNKKIVMYLLVFLCVFIIPASGTYASSNVIENNKSGIPDKKLYQSILKKLGKKSKEKFTRQEAESIKSLNVSGSGKITTLKGIKYLKELKRLELDGHELSNLKGIQSLTKLETLDISQNEIKSLKPLKKLKKLNKLNASGNKIKSAKGLEKLNKLQKLYLNGNDLTGITELKNLKNLKILELSHNKITSLKGLQKQKKLTSLYVDKNNLAGIQEVENLIQLKDLHAEENCLKSLKGIESLKNLTSLNVSTNQLENLNYIQNLPSLEILFTGANQLVKADEISTLRNLEYLDVSYNKITEFPNLSNLSKLDAIVFSYNFLDEKKDELKKKFPKVYMASKQNWFEGGYLLQNIDYSIDFTEPADPKMITLNTTRIAGRIHMSAEKIEMKIEVAQKDDSYFKTYFYADVDADGNFVFEDLNFRQFSEGRCTMSIYIGSENDWTFNHFGGPSLYVYYLN